MPQYCHPAKTSTGADDVTVTPERSQPGSAAIWSTSKAARTNVAGTPGTIADTHGPDTAGTGTVTSICASRGETMVTTLGPSGPPVPKWDSAMNSLPKTTQATLAEAAEGGTEISARRARGGSFR